MPVLPADELQRRLDAARTLRNLKQAELAELMHADGIGKHDLGKIERGEKRLRRMHIDSITRHLRIPEFWLTDPDVDVVVGLRAPRRRITPAETRDELLRLLDDLDQDESQDEPETRKPPDDEDLPGAAGGGGGA